MNNVTAVYENGVLNPSGPLQLAEGQTYFTFRTEYGSRARGCSTMVPR